MIVRKKDRKQLAGYYIEKEDLVLDESVIKIDMDTRRKEILFEWASEQVEEINAKQMNYTSASLFTYIITPTSIGSEISVHCKGTGKKLDLSLIDDEEW